MRKPSLRCRVCLGPDSLKSLWMQYVIYVIWELVYLFEIRVSRLDILFRITRNPPQAHLERPRNSTQYAIVDMCPALGEITTFTMDPCGVVISTATGHVVLQH
jgi:hypothetical protein